LERQESVTQANLSQLLDGCGVTDGSDRSVTVSGLAYRSDKVHPGDAFFCISGFRHDGHDFAEDAVARGAVALVCARPLGTGVPEFVVSDPRHALAIAASRIHGEPSRSLEVVGITGTNGKTTTTYILDSIMRASGRRTGLIGTVETRIGTDVLPSARTTPESADLEILLARMRDEGVSSVSMEVSSHAIDLRRVDGVRFAVAAFTNLTQDHLDYHSTLEEYWSVKRRLFTDLDVGERVVDIDDPRGRALAEECGVHWTVGRDERARVRAVDEQLRPKETLFTLVTPDGEAAVTLPLAGAYNVSNACVAAGCALALGVSLKDVVRGLEHAPQVPGRLERVDAGQEFTVLVDYAHTPDSLAKALAAVRAITPGRVITVFGCGGDRDPEKRPLMGLAAGDGSDEIVITSDNPRSEDPVGIILAIEDGVRRTGAPYRVEIDRRAAIRSAFDRARSGDAVLIAGKGHEDYQIFADRTVHFDDREVAREELRARC
jgi:UDP-N-acetylmuramoyl-L-alanyl-D-glutamate--2,6-diaminopimelate ligase